MAAAVAPRGVPGGGETSSHIPRPEASEALTDVSPRVLLSKAVSTLGVVLVTAGLASGLWQLLAAHPPLAAVGLGLLCFPLAVALRGEGLLVWLPAATQELLLHETLFEFLYDNAGSQNFLRRWGRVWLLTSCSGSKREVRSLLEGMDPTFVDDLFRRSLLDWLPPWLRGVLHPERHHTHAEVEDAPPAASPEVAQKLRGAELGSADLGGRIAPGDGEHHHHHHHAGEPPSPLTAEAVVRALAEREQARQRRLKQPAIWPVALQVLGVRPAVSVLGALVMRGGRAALTTLVAAAGCWGALALALATGGGGGTGAWRLPPWLLRQLAAHGQSLRKVRARAGDALSRASPALGLLLAAAVAAWLRRLQAQRHRLELAAQASQGRRPAALA